MTDCSRPGACSEDGPGVARNGTYRRTLVTQCAFKQKSAQALRIFLYGTVISGFMMCTRNRTCAPSDYRLRATHVYSSQSGFFCAQPYGDFDVVCRWLDQNAAIGGEALSGCHAISSILNEAARS